MPTKNTHLISTLTPGTKEKFETFCKERQINKSKLVEWLLLQHIDQFIEKNEQHD